MTIAVGIAAGDAIVIAADTEESSGYLKSESTKILTVLGQVQLGSGNATAHHPSRGACLISGAGNADYIDGLKEELASVFLDNPDLAGKELQKKLGSCVKEFYRDHVIPFAGFPEDQRPDVRMFIAVQRKFQLSLFFTNRSVIGHALPYKAVGIGCVFAQNLLNRLWEPAATKEIQVLAAYVVFAVKEAVEGCGKLTNIATLHGPKLVQGESGAQLVAPSPAVSHMPSNVIEDLEKEFRTEWATAEHETIWTRIKQSVSGI